MSVASLANALADVALAGAALWVSGTAIKGWLKERSASGSPEDRLANEADARLHYLSASLQNPLILTLVLLGSGAKIILVLAPVAGFLCRMAAAQFSA